MTKPIGVAIVGASGRSTFMFEYLKARPEEGFVTGVYDVVPQRGRFLLDHFGLGDAAVYDSLERAVGDPRADAVMIASWDSAHVEGATAALTAGKHVFCEKPLATTLDDCDAIIGAARQAKGVFYLGMNLRHCPVHEKIHEWVSSGRLGKLVTIEANEHYYGGKGYFRRWNRLRRFGGGLWITKACHDFDILNWLAGAKPVRVFATSSLSHYTPRPEAALYCRDCSLKENCPDFFDVATATNVIDQVWIATEPVTGQKRDLCLWNSDKDTFDNGIAVVEYANGVRATYTVNVISAHGTRQLSIVGTEGMAWGDVSTGVATFWRRHSREKETVDLSELMRSSHGGADVRILADFFRCCRTGERPRSSWSDGRSGVRVGLAARESCDTGEPVALGQ